ncbi:MAG: sulfatase-like hydrolase/transferase [Candidatus Competibacteraceae bacterium]|nr:sulfatase-like hydrolase/transferase [Candidatus Competibacteraceae bacterium]
MSLSNYIKLLFALFLLNSALVFHNRWPTVGVRWVSELSLDLTVLLGVLVLLAAWRPLGRGARGVALVLYLILMLGRYLDVTAPALLGRPINLYWDSRHLPGVAAMLLDGVSGWQILLGGLGLLALVGVLAAVTRWALGTVMAALARPAGHRQLGALSLVLLALYGVGRLSPRLPTERWFALSVGAMLAGQAHSALAATVLHDPRRFTVESPLPDSDLGRLAGGDLLVIFLESYGALVLDDPYFADPLAADFVALQHKLDTAGWTVVSGRVESSTFGGGSWLAHASLLSGVRIADPGDYRSLLASDRSTLVARFAAAGYRTLALQPGLKHPWPEGWFYGFDHILDARRLNYRGPIYGWWAIPDQYSLYWLHQTAVATVARAPLFVVFPTINSHAPFTPVPPYHPDWSVFDALLEATDASDVVELNRRLHGSELAEAFIRSIRYNLQILGGYLSQHAPENALLLVLGDHQPPAAVGGREISWQVPVHVFSRDSALIEASLLAGFQPGLLPGPAALGGIEDLGPWLLRLLDSQQPPPSALAPGSTVGLVSRTADELPAR